MNSTNNRSEFWQKRWNEAAKQPNQFATMGRRSYTISDYFTYISDIINGLGGVNNNDLLLDAAGGCGYLSMYFSPLVKQVDLFDYSSEAIKRANVECSSFNNISPYEDNLLTFAQTNASGKKYHKVIVGSALQYFDNYDEIYTILKNLFEVTQPRGRICISHNTDISAKEQHIKSYEHLDWSQKDKDAAINEELTHRFWLDFAKLEQLATQIGFTQCIRTPINSQLFQSSHMFDFYLVK